MEICKADINSLFWENWKNCVYGFRIVWEVYGNVDGIRAWSDGTFKMHSNIPIYHPEVTLAAKFLYEMVK